MRSGSRKTVSNLESIGFILGCKFWKLLVLLLIKPGLVLISFVPQGIFF